jgi:hypothetical protein
MENSTYYENTLIASTFDKGNYYHDGNIFVIENMKIKYVLENKIGIKQINLSEYYTDMVLSANNDGSTFLIKFLQQLVFGIL